MPTEYESICCNEVHQITPKLQEGPHRCITQHPGFMANFINEDVVELAVYEYRLMITNQFTSKHHKKAWMLS